MNMFEILEKLRGKPKPQREKIVVTASFLITIIVFFIWASVITRTVLQKKNVLTELEKKQNTFETAVSSETAKTSASLFSVFKETYLNLKNISEKTYFYDDNTKEKNILDNKTPEASVGSSEKENIKFISL